MSHPRVDPRRRALLAGAAPLLLSACGALPTAAPHHAVPAFDAADLALADRLRALGLADREAWRLLQGLCSEVGARPAGSAADAKARAWAMREARALGLSNVRDEPLTVRAWVRGPASAVLLAPTPGGAPEPLVVAALGNSIGTPPAGIEAEVAWYPNLAALAADTSERARGRIVLVDTATERTRDGSGYGRAVAARYGAATEGAKRGALAAGIRSIGTDRERIAHTGAMSYPIGVPRIAAFALSVPDAERIAALAAAGLPLRLRLALAAHEVPNAPTGNVIAEVPGTDLAHEIVLIGGHLDSWDLGQGAADDAAGCAIALAAAALLARGAREARDAYAPRRTVRVVLWANEENGFDGARAYGDRYGQVVHQWVGESDFGAGAIYRMQSNVRPEALPLAEAIAQRLKPLGVAWPTDGSANRASAGPDAAVLQRRFRWPALQLSQDGSAYFDVHHTVHDTPERIDPRTLPQNVACWAVASWLAAQSPLAFGPLPPPAVA